MEKEKLSELIKKRDDMLAYYHKFAALPLSEFEIYMATLSALGAKIEAKKRNIQELKWQ